MKSCKDCHEYACGAQGSDNISEICGGEPTHTQNEMVDFGTGAVRENKTGKGRCDLLPMCALLRLSKHYEAGSVGHGERNWEKGIPMHSFLDSAIRHLFKYVDGQMDEDHLCAAAWNILGAMWTEEKRPDMQDIPTRSESLKYHRYGQAMTAGFRAGIEDASPRPEKGSPLAQKPKDDLTPASTVQGQEKATEKLEDMCSSYRMYGDLRNGGYCIGTKEMDRCSCGGDRSKCDFYERVRNESTPGNLFDGD